MTTLLVIALLALIIGVTMGLIVGRRRFYRRSSSGLQRYSNYRNSLITPAIEGIMMLLAKLLLFGGALLLFIAYANNRAKQKAIDKEQLKILEKKK